jgi:hypothetical protein
MKGRPEAATEDICLPTQGNLIGSVAHAWDGSPEPDRGHCYFFKTQPDEGQSTCSVSPVNSTVGKLNKREKTVVPRRSNSV